MSPERDVAWFEINNKKIKIRNKELAAPLIPRRGK